MASAPTRGLTAGLGRNLQPKPAQHPPFAPGRYTWGGPQPPKPSPWGGVPGDQLRSNPWGGVPGDKPLAPKPPPTAPTAAATAPTNSATTQTSPLDSTYYANVAAHQFAGNNQINSLNQASGYATTDLANQLAQMQRQEPLDQLQAQQGANRRGALFSTVLGQQLGNIGNSYLQRQTGAQDAFTRAQAARQAQIQAILGGEPIYEDQQAAAAAERASAAAQKNPAIGEPAGPLDKLAQTIASGGKVPSGDTWFSQPSANPWGGIPATMRNGKQTFTYDKPLAKRASPITSNNLARERALVQALKGRR